MDKLPVEADSFIKRKAAVGGGGSYSISRCQYFAFCIAAVLIIQTSFLWADFENTGSLFSLSFSPRSDEKEAVGVKGCKNEDEQSASQI